MGMTHRKLTLAVLLVSGFAVQVATTILVISLPQIAKYFDTSVAIVSWTVTGPLLSFGVLGPAFGKAGDLWGHKRVFVYGLLLSGLFSLIGAFAWDVVSLIVFRTLAAGFGAATGPAAMAYINRLFAPHERVRPLGYWSFVNAFAPVIGVVAGAPLVVVFGWRLIFVVQSMFCIAAALIATRLLTETERRVDVRFDVAGSATLGAGSVLFLLAINRGGAWGWLSPWIVTMTICAAVAFVGFYFVELRVTDPLMPVRWLHTRNIVFPVLTLGLINVAYMGSFLLVPQMLQEGLGYTAQRVSWLIIARPLAFSLVAPLAGRITGAIGVRRSGMLGAVSTVVGMIAMVLVTDPGMDVLIVTGLALTGISLALAGPSLTALLTSSVDVADVGVASAMQQLVVQMAGVFGAGAMIAIQEGAMGYGTSTSYNIALSFGVVVGVAAIVMARGVRSPATR
jgi:MFS family permease